MSDTAVIPKDFQFGISAIGGSTSSLRLALTQCDVRKVPTRIVPTDEMPGQLAERSETVSEGPYTVTGGFSLFPRPDELDTLLGLITGGTESTDVWLPAHINDGFFFEFDRSTKVYDYTGCKVLRATFSSAPGQQLGLRVDIEGLTRAEQAAGTFQTGLSLSLQQPYTHHQAAVTIDGTVYQVGSIAITIENELILDRFENSITRTEIPHVGQIVTLACDVEFDANGRALLEADPTGLTGACSVVYTNGGRSLTFEFPSLHCANEDPAAQGKRTEMRQDCLFTARTVDGVFSGSLYKITSDPVA